MCWQICCKGSVCKAHLMTWKMLNIYFGEKNYREKFVYSLIPIKQNKICAQKYVNRDNVVGFNLYCDFLTFCYSPNFHHRQKLLL